MTAHLTNAACFTLQLFVWLVIFGGFAAWGISAFLDIRRERKAGMRGKMDPMKPVSDMVKNGTIKR